MNTVITADGRSELVLMALLFAIVVSVAGHVIPELRLFKVTASTKKIVSMMTSVFAVCVVGFAGLAQNMRMFWGFSIIFAVCCAVIALNAWAHERA